MAMTSRDVEQQFQETLGRAPTTSELSYFTQAGQKGYLEPYQMGQALGGTAEGQQRLLEQQTGGLGRMLSQTDAEVMSRAGQTLQSQFLNQGRRYSSGYTAAFADAAKNLSLGRQQAMANFYGQGLGNVAQTSANLGNIQLLEPQRRSEVERENARQLELAKYWYQTQKDDYNNYLNQQSRSQRNQGMLGLGGSLLGAGLGYAAMAGTGGVGPLLGMSLGAGVGRQAGIFGQ